MGLKLGKTVLIEIVSIVQRGMLDGIDISQELRNIEMQLSDDPHNETVELADEYVDRQKKIAESSRDWD
jgi:hypothetical protein